MVVSVRGKNIRFPLGEVIMMGIFIREAIAVKVMDFGTFLKEWYSSDSFIMDAL